MITKVGITITLWDERDNQLAKVGEWLDPQAILHDRRAMFEEVCAAAWPMLNSALDAARDVVYNVELAAEAFDDHA